MVKHYVLEANFEDGSTQKFCVLDSDYDALSASYARLSTTFEYCSKDNTRLEDHIRSLESALREAKPQIYSPNSPTHALIEKLLGSELETDQLCVHGVHTRQRCYECEPASVGSVPETFSESKQPDQYAAHSPECYLRKHRKGYCDCELPKETKGEQE
jgi:hypothetical protein